GRGGHVQQQGAAGHQQQALQESRGGGRQGRSGKDLGVPQFPGAQALQDEFLAPGDEDADERRVDREQQGEADRGGQHHGAQGRSGALEVHLVGRLRHAERQHQGHEQSGEQGALAAPVHGELGAGERGHPARRGGQGPRGGGLGGGGGRGAAHAANSFVVLVPARSGPSAAPFAMPRNASSREA